MIGWRKLCLYDVILRIDWIDIVLRGLKNNFKVYDIKSVTDEDREVFANRN